MHGWYGNDMIHRTTEPTDTCRRQLTQGLKGSWRMWGTGSTSIMNLISKRCIGEKDIPLRKAFSNTDSILLLSFLTTSVLHLPQISFLWLLIGLRAVTFLSLLQMTLLRRYLVAWYLPTALPITIFTR
jgi:hypothetical protein